MKSTHLYQKCASDEDERGIKIPEKTDLNLFSNPAFSGIIETKTEVSFLCFFDQKPGSPVYITH
jgi:hypothetical protein